MTIKICSQCNRKYSNHLGYCMDCIELFETVKKYIEITGVDTRVVPVKELEGWSKRLSSIYDDLYKETENEEFPAETEVMQAIEALETDISAVAS